MSQKKQVFGTSIFFALSVLFGIFLSFKANAISTSLTDFDTRSMSVQLNEINEHALNPNDNYQDLTETLHKTNLLQRQLHICIETGENRLKKINHLLNQSELIGSLKKDTPSYKYLVNEKTNTLNKLESCNFLSYRLGEIADIANKKIDTVSKVKLIEKTPIWQNENANTLLNVSLDLNAMIDQSGLDKLSQANWLGCAIAFIMGLIAAILLRTINVSSKNAISKINRHFILYILPLSAVSIYLNLLFLHTSPALNCILLVNAITLYVIALLSIKLFFVIGMRQNPSQTPMTVFQFSIVFATILSIYTIQFLFYKNNTIPLSYVDFLQATYVIAIIRLIIAGLAGFRSWFTKKLVLAIQYRLFVIATLSLLGYLFYIALSTQSVPPVSFTLLKTLYITLINLAWLWLIYPFLNHWMHGYSRKAAVFTVNIFCLLIIIATWHGYHYLGIALIPDLLITAILILIMLDVHHFLRSIYSRLTSPSELWSQKIHHFLGLKAEETPFELYVLLLLAALPVFILGPLSIMEIWGVTRYQVFTIFNDLHLGLSILGGSIHPTLIIRSITFFCLIVLAGRALASYMVRTKFVNEEQHTKIIVFSLTEYFSYAIALLTALYIAGVNYRSLVVVAGALSVGLGFGLQNLARDFICGLIIMVSKPIKIGEHIEVGDVKNRHEGFIRKIGMLSTQLHTLSYSDVIIPNSEIITKIITNFTFQNNALSRIKLTIALDKNSDFDLAKQLLIDIVSNDPHVIQKAPYEPVVLFELYELTLWIVIDDVNLKDNILSNLNLAIAYGLKALSCDPVSAHIPSKNSDEQ